MALCVSNSPSNKRLCVSKRLSKMSLIPQCLRDSNLFLYTPTSIEPYQHVWKMKSDADFVIPLSTSEQQNKLQSPSSFGPIGFQSLSLSLQLSLFQIKHNYASQIDLTFGVATCNPIFLAQKFVCNQAITFWPNFCHFFGKI